MKRKSISLLVLLVLTLTLLAMSALSVSAAIPKPWMPKNVKTHPGYKSIAIQWEKSSQPDIKGYRIYYSNDGKKFFLKKTLLCKDYPQWNNSKNIVYKITGLSENVLYRFRVVAYVNDEKGHALESNYMTVAAQTVRPMRIRFKAGGKSYIADRFSGGRFYVKGSGQSFAGSRVSSEVADYTNAFNYSRLSANYFINDKGYSSKTGYLVWISTYTQRVYIMKGSKGKWKCIDDWDCATGKPSSPTPTGTNHIKAIHKKVRLRNDVNWWSPFSSWNSLHGCVGDSLVLARPASGGCVRNPDIKAKWMYDNLPIGTTVIVY